MIVKVNVVKSAHQSASLMRSVISFRDHPVVPVTTVHQVQLVHKVSPVPMDGLDQLVLLVHQVVPVQLVHLVLVNQVHAVKLVNQVFPAKKVQRVILVRWVSVVTLALRVSQVVMVFKVHQVLQANQDVVVSQAHKARSGLEVSKDQRVHRVPLVKWV